MRYIVLLNRQVGNIEAQDEAMKEYEAQDGINLLSKMVVSSVEGVKREQRGSKKGAKREPKGSKEGAKRCWGSGMVGSGGGRGGPMLH